MNILLVEDQAIICGALAALLNLEDDFSVIATAANGAIAKKMMAEQEVIDLVISDIQMPECDGIALCQWLSQYHPKTPVIILTTFARAGYLKRAMAAGANGFLLKDSPLERLAGAVRDVYAGRKVIDSELALSALGCDDPLTDKERKALGLAGQGLSTAQIAKALFLTQGTVRNYLSEAMNKLGADNRTQAARIAMDKGWL